MEKLITILLMMFLSGCSDCDKNDCVEPPHPFQFSITDRISKEDLVFSAYARYHPDSIRLYYLDGGEKIELRLWTDRKEMGYGIFSNQTLPYLSASRLIKDYYLQVSHDDVDTLLLDVRQIDFECCTVFQWAQSYFNGRVLRNSPEDFTVFLIEK